MVRERTSRLVEESAMNEHKGRITEAFAAQADVYDAAADLATWDRASLECPLGVPKVPRVV